MCGAVVFALSGIQNRGNMVGSREEAWTENASF